MAPTLLAAGELTRTSTGEAVQFWILAVVAVLGALGMVFTKKAVHSALMLAVAMVCLAILYIAQGAVFLGIVQIVVYTGAVMMLFLFVLMLIGVDSADSLVETLRGQRIAAAVAGIGFGVLLIAGIANAAVGSFAGTDAANSQYGNNILGLAHLLFTRYVWAFEATGALLITAAVGAMVLAHRERTEPRKSQRELSEERVRDGRRITPLPAPGVYARHNGVDVPGLLPDGTPSPLSVNRTLAARPGLHIHLPAEAARVRGGDLAEFAGLTATAVIDTVTGAALLPGSDAAERAVSGHNVEEVETAPTPAPAGSAPPHSPDKTSESDDVSADGTSIAGAPPPDTSGRDEPPQAHDGREENR